MGTSDVERIAGLERDMENLKKSFDGHMRFHERNNTNVQAWVMIALTGFNILVAVYGIKVASDISQPHQPVGIERQYQGSAKP
jgi:hypothetical protein